MRTSFDPSRPEPRSAIAELPAAEPADVVIIEDDTTLSEMLTYSLTNRGYRCRHLADGREALEQLVAAPRPTLPPVVVINIDLPGLSRIGAIEHLERAHAEGFRIIVFTRTGSEREHVRALNAGAIDYFVKPISMPVLTAKIIRFLWDHPRQ